MNLMHLLPYLSLLICLLFTLIAESSARALTDLDSFISTPIGDRFDSDYFSNYPSQTVAQKKSLLSRLRRGYYYIDDGQITPVDPADFSQNSNRRQDSYNSNESSQNDVKYTPLVRYHKAHAKRKKLFVPNFFG